jgi:hypothetical protein
MDKTLLLDAVRQLDTPASQSRNGKAARVQAVRQFNALLTEAKLLYPRRADIHAIFPFQQVPLWDHFSNEVCRLIRSLELRPPRSIAQVIDGIVLPPDALPALALDLQEFREAVAHGLKKATLLLAGSMAEALLLLRHPDKTERGPGLHDLVKQATSQGLFGADTLRQLETLTDYRDLIHARAAKRNRIVLNDVRIDHAVLALKHLCHDLQNTNIRFK